MFPKLWQGGGGENGKFPSFLETSDSVHNNKKRLWWFCINDVVLDIVGFKVMDFKVFTFMKRKYYDMKQRNEEDKPPLTWVEEKDTITARRMKK